MKYFLIILAILTFGGVNANDGAFYMSGNQLIPVNETQVSLSKEILTIKRVGRMIHIDVDYTFYNPGLSKEVLVGFEAPMPRGGAAFEFNDINVTRNHPYLKNFIVVVNGERIPYKADIVNKKAFESIGSLAGFPKELIDSLNDMRMKRSSGLLMGEFESQYIFVNYFTVNFKPGINKIHHRYSIPQSGSVDIPLDFQYILTAANRWANGQIDDFTLILDMGDYNEFYVNQTFFKGTQNWNKGGKIRICYPKQSDEANEGYHIGGADDKGSLYARTKKNPLIYKQNNFKPKGELTIWTVQDAYEYMELYGDSVVFDLEQFYIGYQFYNYIDLVEFVKDEYTLKVLRNYPFALRGYAFKNKSIRKYYDNTGWYDPDPDYKADINDLRKTEIEWINRLSVFDQGKGNE